MQVKIFSYRVWDQINGTSIIPPRMATPEFIKASSGEAIGDGVLVDEKMVDENGQEILADNRR